MSRSEPHIFFRVYDFLLFPFFIAGFFPLLAYFVKPIIEDPLLKRDYIKRRIVNHINKGAVIEEVWIKTGDQLTQIY